MRTHPHAHTIFLCLSNLSLSVCTLRDPGSFDWEYIYIYIGSFSTCLLWCVKLIFGMSTQSKKPESTHPVCVWFLFSAAHNAVFIFAPFSKRGIWFFYVPLRLEVLSIPTVSSFYSFFFPPFLFKNSVLLQGVSQKLKSSFQAPSFCQDEYQLARWISVGQSVERKGFWQDFWRPRSSSCLSLLQFSHNWLSRTAAIKTPYQMQTEESQSFMIHQ